MPWDSYTQGSILLLWLTISFLYYIGYQNAAFRNLPYSENVQYQRLLKLYSILVPTLVLTPNSQPRLIHKSANILGRFQLVNTGLLTHN